MPPLNLTQPKARSRRTKVVASQWIAGRSVRPPFDRAALFATASLLALTLASPSADAKPLGAWTPAPSAAALAAAQSAAQEAARAASQATNSLKRATLAIQAQQASQQAARDAARAQLNATPNGLRPGGLQIGTGVVGPDGSVNSSLWQGANLPTQFADGDRIKVDIKQTQQKAILTWDTFNIGGQTDLAFNQQGNRDWIALNRVIDPSLAPSRILGTMKADGSVYVINRSGIVFGGTSQINVGSLLASSLDIKGPNTNLPADRDQAFLSGLFASGTAVFQGRKLPDATGALVIPDTIEGNVVVEAGAVLRAAPAGGLNDGGRIMLFGPNVHNAGSIFAPDGQAVIAAGRTVMATIGADKQLTFTAAPAVATSDPYYFNPNYTGEPAYTALNAGLISADRGTILMRGTLVEQAGVLTATTSINRPGSVSLVAEGRLTLRSGSSILMDAVAMLDAEGKDVTAPAFNGGLAVALKGSSVDVQADTFIRAPSGKVTIDATNKSVDFDAHRNIPDDNGRAFLAPGAVIDVSGLTDVLVPVERAVIKIQPRGQEFANSPLQRNSALRGQDIWIDTRLSGVRDDGVAWIGTPLLDASGYVGLIQKSTREYLVAGGSVAINGQRDVVVPQGATVNVSGGYVRYTGGTVHVTRLVGANGRLYDIANADPMVTYLGVYSGFTRHNARWGITETWTNPLIRISYYDPGYYEGAAAGALSISGTGEQGVVYFDGRMIADIVNGERQIAKSEPAASGKLSITSQGNILVSKAGQRLPADIALDSTLPIPSGETGQGLWSWLSADALSEIGLGSLKLTTPGGLLVAGDAKLEVVPGGGITLTGGVIRIDGKLKAPAGSIELRTQQHSDAAILLPSDALGLVPSVPGGVLTGNTPAPVELVLSQEVELPAGSILPVAVTASVTVWPQGVPLANATRATGSRRVTLAADWIVPAYDDGFGSINRAINYLDRSQEWHAGEVVPAGTTVYNYWLPAGYTLPANAFPNGQPIPETSATFPAGTILTVSTTLGKGTVIPQGALLPQNTAVAPSLGRFGSVTLGSAASLNTHGLWVDDRVGASAYGAKFINGGFMTIATDASSTGYGGLDNTGDINLNVGSALDASSGGHILLNGSWASKNGVPLGKGGDISILAYAGLMYGTSSGPAVPTRANLASVHLDGTMSSYGFTSGGRLNLRVGELVIGPGEDAPNRLVLGYDFFRDNSFGAYALSSVNDTIILDGIVDAPAIIAPRQISYVPTYQPFTAGANPLVAGAVKVGLLSDYRRRAVDFAVDGNTYYNPATGATANFGVADRLVVGANTKILAEAGASVRLSTAGKLIVAGEIRARGGGIELSGPATSKVFNFQEYFDGNSAIWLASTAVLDASGTILLDDLPPGNGRFDPPRLGRVLDGGTVTISSAKGSVVGMEGARIDVSGTSAELDALRSSGDLLGKRSLPARAGLMPVNPYARQAVWSDGGTISFAAADGFSFDGALSARGGAPEARGGTIVYTALRSLSSGVFSPTTLSAASIPTLPDSVALGDALFLSTHTIRTNLIQQSGADSLILNGGPDSALNIEGGVALMLPGSISLGFSVLNMVPAQIAPGGAPATTEPVAQLSASYIGVTGSSSDYWFKNVSANDVRGALALNADTIDVEGFLAFNNLQTLDLRAAGDVRLFGIGVAANHDAGGGVYLPHTQYRGGLAASGNVIITAGQVYPGTGQEFTIKSTGVDNTIRFVQNGARPTVPLSAGGSLQITASHIVHGGTTRAPQGSITFGEAGITQSVDFLPGSLTSVSLEGATIPYGATQDQLSWLFSGRELSAPPDKVISVTANRANMAPGAVLDLSAGGDLIAPEFVAGTGGSRDVLRLSDRQVYAILPGYSGTRAPVDKTAGGATSYGDVYLTGVPGLADGYYTLLPAQYAVLPGAYRVVARPGGDPRSGGVLRDGTVVAVGFYASSDHSGRDANVTLFEVQSREVWRQYSEYKLTSANAFFGNLELLHADVAPYRPQDAGRLAISAANALVLQAQTLFGTADGGRGGRVDIGGRDLQILGQGGVARDGYLGLSAADLTNLKAESILLGGTRAADGTGQLITAVANSILVSNDASSALVAPEVLFAIKTDTSGADPNAGNGLVFEARSVVIGDGTPTQTTPLRTSGDGALVRVSGGGLTAISTSNAPANSVARVLVASGAQLIGKGSLALQSTGTINLETGAILATRNIDVLTQRIALVGAGASGVPTTGFVLDAQSLALLGGIASIKLTSATTIDSYGDVAIRLARGGTQQTSLTLNASGLVGHGGNLTLEAGRIAFTNTTTKTPDAAVSGGGALMLAADEIVFGAGNKQISGFSRLDGSASVRVLADGKGSMDFGSVPVSLTTPLVTTAAAADQELRTTAALALLGGTGSTPTADGLGGLLSMTGSAMTVDTAVVLPSGGMTLAANTGDITLGANARLIATGTSKQIFDKRIDTGGGAISLLVANGNITSHAGAVLDVSASPLGGDAGAVTLQARGTVALPGTMGGNASAGFEGGRFTLVTGGAVDLDPLASLLMGSGFRGGVDVRSGQGNLSLTGSLVASNVVLTADGGLVYVSGLIDASGKKGGRIDLYGRDGVTLASSGRLAATGSDPSKRGGDIFIGTAGTGVITLAAGSVIDVSGGTLAGLSGGTLNLRAPIINGDVNVTIGSTIAGARSVVLEAYKVFDTTNSNFDGIIDPLGLYDSAGVALSSGVNQAHLDFYNTELVAFVQNPGVNFARFSGVANFRGRAGIELRNSDASRNNGDILVVSDWDFGAGSYDAGSGAHSLTWRTGVEPGVLTLRAAGNIDVRAVLTDGFFHTSSTPVPYDTPSIPVPHAADLMPADWGDSWSYRIVGGADLASVNPKALLPLSAVLALGGGDVSISGHRTLFKTTAQGPEVYAELPNMIRTGTGFIDIAAGRDVALRDTVAPGVIYTAGRPSADLPDAGLVDVNGSLVPTNPSGFVKPTISADWVCTLSEGCGVNYLVTAPVWPEAAGDISIVAQRDVIGLQNVIDTTGAQSGVPGASIGNAWTPWLLRTGLIQPQQDIGLFNPNETLYYENVYYHNLGHPRQTASWINFGSFNQGVMSIGGDVEIIAGRDANQFSASLPTTVRVSGGISALEPRAVAHVTGGGDLRVRAGRDIVSGHYYVGKGVGELQAGGSFRSGWVVSTVLGVADSAFTLSAGGSIDLGGVFSPTFLPVPLFWATDETTLTSDFYEYSRNSGVSLLASGGDIAIGNGGGPFTTPSSGSTPSGTVRRGRSGYYGAVWPASLIAHAASGGIDFMKGGNSPTIELFPSPTGQLELIAERDVQLRANSPLGLAMLDKNPYVFPSPLAPKPSGLNSLSMWRNNNYITALSYSTYDVGVLGGLPDFDFDTYDPGILPNYDFRRTHLNDAEPIRIYSRTGDIVDRLGMVWLNVAKPAQIRAGRDIVDLPVTAQNIREEDVTSVIAGRDMYGSAIAKRLYELHFERRFANEGTGTMTIAVGGPGTVYVEAGRNIGPLMSADSRHLGGIVATGPANNRLLPREGADVIVVFGVANGMDSDAMITRYLDPANAAEVPRNYGPELVVYLNELRRQRGDGLQDFTAEGAVAEFRTLSTVQQRAFLYQILFAELQTAADPIKNPDNYGKYDRSYAAIQTLFPPGLGYPDTSGTATKVNSGSLDLRSASIQTQFGGNISILAPVGRIVVGSQSATPLSNDPSKTGILTLRGGDIRIMAERDVLVNQSRIFTEQGGDILMWSSNGDLNAGKGAKTSAFYPPLLRVTDLDGLSSVDPAGLVTGAGVGALQTVVGQKRATVYLIAPHGTVDLGDAGVRSSGDVNLAALQILNATNLQAQGTTTGIPTIQAPSQSNLTAASNVAAAAAQQAAPPSQGRGNAQPSVIIVEVLGFGGGDGNSNEGGAREERDRRSENVVPRYSPGGPVRILGVGPLTDEEKRLLNEEERLHL